MFKNLKLEELYHLAVQRDVTHTMDAYSFILEKIEHLTDEELELIELVWDIYANTGCILKAKGDESYQTPN